MTMAARGGTRASPWLVVACGALLHAQEQLPGRARDPRTVQTRMPWCGRATPDATVHAPRYCDASLGDAERLDDLLSRMSVDEKIDLIGHDATAGGPHVPPYIWWNEGLHGVARSKGVRFAGNLSVATSFAQVIHQVASLNRTLWRAIGDATSVELRAFINAGQAGPTVWTPNVNLFRDPRWGRGQETAGEDPTVVATYAFEMVRGLQAASGGRLRAAACCKHFSAADIEGGGKVPNRHSLNISVSQRDLSDSYNVPFEACVRAARVAGVMCGYSALNGVPACAHAPLLNATLRQRWGFDGYVVADCGAVRDVYKHHAYAADAAGAVAATLAAGCDLECGGGDYLRELPGLLTERRVSGAQLNSAVRRALGTLMRAGAFDARPPPGSVLREWARLGPADVDSAAHRALAFESAVQGFVLLENANRTLPLEDTLWPTPAPEPAAPPTGRSLKRRTRCSAPPGKRTLALVGELSAKPRFLYGSYGGKPPHARTVLKAFQEGPFSPRHWHVCLAQGGPLQRPPKERQIADVTLAVSQADAAVAVLGCHLDDERETRDRKTLALTEQQEALAVAVADAARGPVILAIMCGGPVDVGARVRASRPAAVLWGAYPGQAGGEALAALVWGARHPAACLPITWYPNEYIKGVSRADMRMRAAPAAAAGGRAFAGRTHRFYAGPTIYPFGHGLTYEPMSVVGLVLDGVAQVRVEAIDAALADSAPHFLLAPPLVHVSVRVANEGVHDAPFVVLLLASPPQAAPASAPAAEVAGFERVLVPAGGSANVKLPISAHHLSLADQSGVRRALPGVWTLRAGKLSAALHVTS